MAAATRARAIPAALFLVTWALPSCAAKPNAVECAAMLDRYVDMRGDQDPAMAGLPEARAAELRDAKRAAKHGDDSYAHALAQCQREISRTEYDCAMAAKAPNDWEACVE